MGEHGTDRHADRGTGAAETRLGRLGAPLFLLIWFACMALAIYANVEGGRIAAETFRGPRGMAGWQRTLLILWTFVPLILALTAIVLFRVRRHSPVAGLLSLALLLLAATQIMAANWWGKELDILRHILANSGFLAFILALLIFPTGRFTSRWGVGAALAAAAFLALDVVQQAHQHQGPGSHFILDAHIYSLNAAIVAGFFALGAATLVRRLHANESGTERQQILWVLAGLIAFVLMYLAWITFNLLPRDLSFSAPRYWGPLGGIALALAFTSLGLGFMIALIRYRLYDADAVLSRSAAFAALSALFGIFYLAGEQGLHWLLSPLLADEGTRKLAIAALALTVVAPLKSSAVDWADRRLRKPLTDLRDKLPAELAELRETASMEEMAGHAAARVAAALRPQHLAFVIDGRPALLEGMEEEAFADWLRMPQPDNAGPQKGQPGDALFPLRCALRTGEDGESAPFGWLLVGPRPDGETYRADERAALTSVVPALARALRRVRHRMAQEAKLDGILGMLKDRCR